MTITFDFTGRTVVVTGAAQGIGADIARLFVASGARVAVLDLKADALAAAWGDRSATVAPIAVDVSDAEAVSAAVAEVVDWAGRIDIAVNNAGITRDAVIWKLTSEQWRQVIGVHLDGTFHVTRSVVPHMRSAKRGRIINVTTYTGMHGNIGQGNYVPERCSATA